jgi:hypothetical protein
MIREASVMFRLRVEHRLFSAPPRDKIRTLEVCHDADLSHLYSVE